MNNRIVLVDDEADVCRLVQRKLGENNYSVTALTTADKLPEVIREEKPCLVILDLHIRRDGQDGLQIMQELRNRHPDLPVAILTGDADYDTAVRACQLGACDYMVKPVDWDHLLNVAYLYAYLDNPPEAPAAKSA